MSVNTKKTEDGSKLDTAPQMHLLVSSGGSRAILAGAGVVLICDLAGIKNWKSIGGISGGSLPTVMMASGMDARTTVTTAIDVDFSSLLTRRGSMLKILFAYLMQSRYEKSRPRFGVLSSEKVGVFIEKVVAEQMGNVPLWPYSYWTMANVGDDQLVFNSTGVHQMKKNGGYRLLNTEAGPLGAAIRGSCAVPGIIDAVPIEVAGENFWLHDGALSSEGRTPVSIPEKFYGAQPQNIIVCDVGDGGHDAKSVRKNKRQLTLWRWICGKLCVPDFEPEPLDTDKGYVVILPTITNFSSLQFTLTRDQKWQAVMSGFMGGIAPLAKAGLLRGDALVRAELVAEAFKAIVTNCETTKAPVGLLATLTEALLQENGLWAPR